jgi:hypothetical protein
MTVLGEERQIEVPLTEILCNEIQTDLFLEEVKLLLQFEDSYISGRRVLTPVAALDVHARNYAGEEKRALGREYGIDEDIIALAVKRVDRVARIVNGNYDLEEFNPTYQRFLRIYHSYKDIPNLIERNKSAETELGCLLSENPHVEEIFQYLSTGFPIRNYFAMYEIGGAGGLDEDPYTKSFQKIFLKGEWDHISTVAIAQAALFRKYINGETNIGTRMSVSIQRIIANKEKFPYEDPRYYFANYVRKFFELGFLLDYSHSKGTKNIDRLKIFLSDPADPFSVDISAYYRDGFANYGMPYGLKILMETCISCEQKNLREKIEREYFCASGTVKRLLLLGYRFLENEILIGQPLHSIKPSIAYYARNRRPENERIMQLMAEAID